jgi:hypothetical protein
MAASPAEPAPFGCQILCDATRAGPASHDGTGLRHVLLTPPGDRRRFALDVECRDLPAPEALTCTLGPHALPLWGEIEVIAKLLDHPAHLVLRAVQTDSVAALCAQHGIALARCDTAALWRVVGYREVRVAQSVLLAPTLLHV